MATESPLVHDGAQTTANSDMSGGVTLSGQSSSGQFLAVKIVSARKVDVANSGGEAIYGILQNKPASGQAADVGIMGVTKAVAGGVVTGGNFLMTDTAGRLIVATGTNNRVAQAIENGVTGAIITVAIVPASLGRDAT